MIHPNADGSGQALVTRRRLLQGAAGVAAVGLLPGALAACGGGDSTTGGTAAGGTGSTTTSTTGTVGGSLDYLGWQGDDLTEVLAPWRKENGVQLHSSYISALRDIGPKFAAGGADKVDIIGGSSNGVPLELESGVPLMALDLGQIPNLAGVNPFFSENDGLKNEDGDLVAVPYAWGVEGISYDSSKIPAPKRWDDLLAPSFTGKITCIDDAFTMFATTAPGLGLNAEEMTQPEFEKLKAYMAEVLAQVKTVSPTFGDMANLLASGEVVAGWAGYTSLNAFAAEAGNPNIRTVVDFPEGSASYAETYSIPDTGQNPATAYAMINEVLDPKVNAEVSNALLAAPTVDAAWPEVSNTVKGLFPRKAAERNEILERAPLVVNAPLESSEFVTFSEFEEAWEELKSAA